MKKPIQIEVIKHKEARRKNVPTAELESTMQEKNKTP